MSLDLNEIEIGSLLEILRFARLSAESTMEALEERGLVGLPHTNDKIEYINQLLNGIGILSRKLQAAIDLKDRPVDDMLN